MYIRSGLISLVNESEAVNLIKETQLTLKTTKILSPENNFRQFEYDRIISYIDDIQSDIGNSVIVHTNATYLYNTA